MATERQYQEVFDKEYNISFFKPKKDQCDTCYSYKIIENKNQKDEEANVAHLRNVKIARELKENEKIQATEDNTVSTSCFDLQKVILIPYSEVSVFYYKSKLSVFNFTVFDLISKQGYSFIWHEQIAKRGANEVASCLYIFLKKMAAQGKKTKYILMV